MSQGPAPRPPQETVHLLSVDVEEHFQASVFDRVLAREAWDAQPSRVEANTDRLLDVFERHRVRATFFTLGWVAQRQPALIRRIAAGGHEIGSHSWWHRKVKNQKREEFRDEVRRSKATLEEVSGTPVRGFRAPSFSIVPGTEWAFDVLLAEGYSYDSSLFPIRRPDYGYPSAPRIPHRIGRPTGSLMEFPLATLSFGGMRIPCAGGGYLRQFPRGIIPAGFRQLARSGQPGMFYIHPWEVDPDQPRLAVGWLNTARHYRGLRSTMSKLESLLGAFRFTSVARWLQEHPL